MGVLKKSVLGKPSGVVGDILFRYKDGKTIIGTRPVSYMPGMDVNSVNRRNRFGITAKFSRAVNSLPSFKNLWDNVTPNNISPFNGIFKASYPFVTPTDVTDMANIVPQLFGFDVTTTDVSIDATEVSVSIDPIGTNASIDTNVEKFIQLGTVIKCTDGTVDTLPKLVFIPLKSSNVVLNLANPLSFTITLCDQDSDLYSYFDTHVSYLAFVTLDEFGKAIHYSKGFNA
ncbi:MAG: hypothetical protein WC644_01885 [Ignavibacteria bacterium]